MRPHCPATLQAVQELYEECQATFDPNNVAALLHLHPYHLDALLTMHDLYRSMGEQAYAGGHARCARCAAERSPSACPAVRARRSSRTSAAWRAAMAGTGRGDVVCMVWVFGLCRCRSVRKCLPGRMEQDSTTQA